MVITGSDDTYNALTAKPAKFDVTLRNAADFIFTLMVNDVLRIPRAIDSGMLKNWVRHTLKQVLKICALCFSQENTVQYYNGKELGLLCHYLLYVQMRWLILVN